MNCIYRKATTDDFETLVAMRVEFILDLHPEYDQPMIEKIREGTVRYLREHIDLHRYIGFFGLADGEIVCAAALLLYDLPPLDSAQSRTIGHVLNFFTKAQHRGKGYGTGLMDFIKTAAKEEGIMRLFLNATDIGYPLYKKSGFIDPQHKAMELTLS